MDNHSTPNAAPAEAEAVITDLFRLELADGLPAESQGKALRYKVVRLRETGVEHERKAIQAAERVMVVNGVPRLLVSDSDFRFALTAQHIEAFECDGNRIPAALIDLALVGRLTSHDFGLIEQRVFLIELAAQVRYGKVAQADFDRLLRGETAEGAPPAAPQPVGQAAIVGAPADAGEPGPALLADYAGSSAAGPAAGDGR